MKKEIMKKAWENKKRMNSLTFSACLSMAWSQVRGYSKWQKEMIESFATPNDVWEGRKIITEKFDASSWWKVCEALGVDKPIKNKGYSILKKNEEFEERLYEAKYGERDKQRRIAEMLGY